MSKFIAWLMALFGFGPKPVVTPTPGPTPGPTPVDPGPPPPVNPGPAPFTPKFPLVGGPAQPPMAGFESYGKPDANGFCTVAEVEAMRAFIAAADPTYRLAKYFLCPALVNTFADAKSRIAAQWQCSQVCYNNLSAFQGGSNPFYPGFVVGISVRPGQEQDVDTNPLKWMTTNAGVIPTAGVTNPELGDYLAVSSIPDPDLRLYSGAGIAAAMRTRWVNDKRIRDQNKGSKGFGP